MAINDMIADPTLRLALDTSTQTREQAIALLDLVANAPASSPPSTEFQIEVSKQQKLLITYLAQLRGLHRDAHVGARETKALTAEARQEVDKLHLQLQNLYYEQRHLQGEILACESYEYVRDARLPLIPVEQFLAEHPEHADADSVALTIARIDHEHTERLALEEERQGLLKKKQGLIADNKKRKDDLANLDKDLEKFIDGKLWVLVNEHRSLTHTAIPVTMIRHRQLLSTEQSPLLTSSKSGYTIVPNQLSAAVGDIIEFTFWPLNHSVVRAEYKNSCIPYEDTGGNKQGFFSGFRPTTVGTTDLSNFQVRVNDTAPIFYYCAAPDACIKEGMIGVVNANSTETFDTQLAYAQNSTVMYVPGQYFPVEGDSPTSTSSMSSSSVPSSSSTSSFSVTSTPTPTRPTLSAGAIAGIAIGGAVVILITAMVLYLCGRQRTMGELLRHNHTQPPSYGQQNLSMAYPSKAQQMPIDSSGIDRYSALGGMYDRSAVDTEGYRSKSPPVDEMRKLVPPMDIPGLPEPVSPVQRDYSGHPSPLAPPYQPFNTSIPAPLRANRNTSQYGVHELASESKNDSMP
ncbi:hypothetical protein B7494_g2817 [Chlorociboria aeruginascens]|nr:hypothetical protein B7494_g2817 [Chlorociboria aeruginascens]